MSSYCAVRHPSLSSKSRQGTVGWRTVEAVANQVLGRHKKSENASVIAVRTQLEMRSQPGTITSSDVWLRRFVDRCQTLSGQLTPVPAPTLRSSLEVLVSDALPPTLSKPQLLIVQATFIKVVLRMTRMGIIEDSEVIGILNAAITSEDSLSLMAALRREVRKIVTKASDLEFDDRRHREPRVSRALEIITERFRNPNLSVGQVAAELRVSRWYLTRLLRRETGQTFQLHLHRMRVDLARVLLHDPTLSVKEVAFMVGYRSTTQLDRHFRQICGTTPTEYRLVQS
jgi:AraC-like DNA-binding protein